jgi:phosphoribosyl 1,2-cyclic phosphodiesterase
VQVTFWGTRGSIAAPGPRTVRYGGNTSCVEVRTDNGTLFILDSGTGIRELGMSLLARQPEVQGHILISHTHWDHIQGWPFFTPALMKGNEFTLHALGGLNTSLEQVLANQMEYMYFPITLDAMQARISFDETREGQFSVDGVRVTAHYLNHTSICLGYRIEADGKTLVYASDTEPHGLTAAPGMQLRPPVFGEKPRLVHGEDQELAEFTRGADLLILDAQYTDEEYPKKVGWGHSTTSYATDIGVLAGVARLALYHHDPTHDDDAVDAIVEAAQRRAAAYGAEIDVFGAAERLTVQLS